MDDISQRPATPDTAMPASNLAATGRQSIDQSEDEFSGLIAQAEADIRGKLSVLDYPGSDMPISRYLSGETGVDTEGKMLNINPISEEQNLHQNPTVIGAQSMIIGATVSNILVPDIGNLKSIVEHQNSNVRSPQQATCSAVTCTSESSPIVDQQVKLKELMVQSDQPKRPSSRGMSLGAAASVSYIGIEIQKPAIDVDIPVTMAGSAGTEMAPAAAQGSGETTVSHVRMMTEDGMESHKVNNQVKASSSDPPSNPSPNQPSESRSSSNTTQNTPLDTNIQVAHSNTAVTTVAGACEEVMMDTNTTSQTEILTTEPSLSVSVVSDEHKDNEECVVGIDKPTLTKSILSVSNTCTSENIPKQTTDQNVLETAILPSDIQIISQTLSLQENSCMLVSGNDSAKSSNLDSLIEQTIDKARSEGLGTLHNVLPKDVVGTDVPVSTAITELSALANMVDTVGKPRPNVGSSLSMENTNQFMVGQLGNYSSKTNMVTANAMNTKLCKDDIHMSKSQISLNQAQESDNKLETTAKKSEIVHDKTISENICKKDTICVESAMANSIAGAQHDTAVTDLTDSSSDANTKVIVQEASETENNTEDDQLVNVTDTADSSSLTSVGEMLLITDVRSIPADELGEVDPSPPLPDPAASSITQASQALAVTPPIASTSQVASTSKSQASVSSASSFTGAKSTQNLSSANMTTSLVPLSSNSIATSHLTSISTNESGKAHNSATGQGSATSLQTAVGATSDDSLPVISGVYSINMIKQEPMDYEEVHVAVTSDISRKPDTQVQSKKGVTYAFKPTQGTTVSTGSRLHAPVVTIAGGQIGHVRQAGIQHNNGLRKQVSNQIQKQVNGKTFIKAKTPAPVPTTGKSTVVKYVLPPQFASIVKATQSQSAVSQTIAKATAKLAPGPVKTSTIITLGLPEKKREPNLKTINIDSVGVAVVTDLIARKNPIPVYKPPPVPDGVIAPSIIYPCYECGDTFYRASSMSQHKYRCSMTIKYKCEVCKTKKIFTNKCQLLGHLRSHMKIAKTQAVPIHIKSDSIEIESNYNNTEFWETRQWYKEVDEVIEGEPVTPKAVPAVTADNNKVQSPPVKASLLACSECGEEFANSDNFANQRSDHFTKGDDSKTTHYCGICPMYLPSKCSVLAHRRLHSIKFMGQKDCGPYTCPECGIVFNEHALSSFLLHLKNDCYHLSRRSGFQCSKCVCYLTSVTALQNHLMVSLEHYYKCNKCPMALKTLKTFENHYNSKHPSSDVNMEDWAVEDRVKIIYRCHVCDTLIDDKSFLLSHIERHVTDLKQKGDYRHLCMHCGLICKTKSAFLKHMETFRHAGNRSTRPFYCSICRHDKGSSLEFMHHVFSCHFIKESKVAAEICAQCGLVCIDRQMLLMHANKCFAKSKITRVLGDSEAVPRQKSKNTKQAQPSVLDRDKVPAVPLKLKKISDDLSPVCVNCLYDFQESDSLRTSHVLMHRKEGVNICLYCDKIDFLDENDFIDHEKNCRTEYCKTVAKKTHEGISLKAVTNIGDLSETCLSCNYTFKSKGNRSHHIRNHRQDRIYICLHCDRTVFQSHSELRNHEIACGTLGGKTFKEVFHKEDNTNSKPTISDNKTIISDKKTNNTIIKDKITLKISKGKPGEKNVLNESTFLVQYKCDQCDEMFTRKDKQEEHKRREHGIHPCHLCGLMYESQGSLKQHLTISHEGKKLVYYCWICRERKISNYFSNVLQLEKHLSAKHRLKNWDKSMMVPELPGVKGKIVGPEAGKRKHVAGSHDVAPVKKLRVAGDKSFKCAKCEFSCEIREDFLTHIKEHKKENAVQCIECGLCFTVTSSLKKHLFMVHKVRDFVNYFKEHNISEEQEEEVEEDIKVDDDIEREPIEPPKVVESSEDETGNPQECKVCYKQFDTEHSMKSHMRVHGMAFIKKSRRRALSMTPPKKKARTDSECSSQASNKSSIDEKVEDISDNLGEQATGNVKTKT